MEDTRTEPSMDDILASIKRIIADDGPDPATPSNDPAGRDDDALPALLDDTPEGDPVIAGAASYPAPPPPAAPPPAAAMAPAAPPAAPAPSPAGATLVSENAASASRQSLAALSSMVVRPASGDITLDGLVRELIRPMLTEWLDAHLPAVVEKLVAREIARITAEQA